MVFSPALQHDPDSFVWSYFKSHEWGFDRTYTKEEITQKGAQINKDNKPSKDTIERLSGIIDTEDPRFEKIKEESFNKWEKSVAHLCESLNTSVEAYYDRQNSVYDQIQQTCVDKRELNVPELDETDTTENLKTLAGAPWLFRDLPGS